MRLASSDPGNAGWQRGLALTKGKIGDVHLARGDLTAALAAFRATHEIFARLAAADPGNADWQRDLWVSCWRMATMAEQTGSVEARAWWRKVYDVLSGMKERGLFVSAEDEQALAQLRQKVEGESAQSSRPRGYAGSPAHPAADPDRAAQLNVEYQEKLKEWQDLPLWRRLWRKRPEPPKGI